MKKHKGFSVFLAAAVFVSSMWSGLPSRADTLDSPITNLSNLQVALNNAVTNGGTVTMTQNLPMVKPSFLMGMAKRSRL